MAVPREATPRRATLIVLDSFGMGALPDAAAWGDALADTWGHVWACCAPSLPNLLSLGLGNLRPLHSLPVAASPTASFGRMMTAGDGKDTVAGHWELAGVTVTERFATFPKGFPQALLDALTEETGYHFLGNVAASGTAILEKLGEEHLRTGRPIVYTSADSVLQIAAHEDVLSLDALYALCEVAFRHVTPLRVARVIARPFRGAPGAPGGFVRTENRRDFALQPPGVTLMDALQAAGLPTTSVGKVKNIYGDRGFDRAIKAGNNASIFQATLDALDSQTTGLIFANLVDFDMLYGHRRDPLGYAQALEAVDARLPELLARMGEGDLLILTADHGNDPTYRGNDHTREYVPVLMYRVGQPARDLGVRTTLADVGATIAAHFSLTLPAGASMLAPMLAPEAA